ncbi:MAG: TIGR03619 family F420-dependent LLM class oxidoreductase [Pseudomonadota bacterium]
MHIGIIPFATSQTMPVVELGIEAESLGFESLFLPEHAVVPANFDSPYPEGGDTPDEYRRMLDPYTALAAVAGATERIRIGTAITLILERPPLLAAGQLATLDVVSDGRLIVGAGTGWLREEGAIFGVDWERRGTQMKDYFRAIKRCWQDPVSAYSGTHVSFPELVCEPKPVQKPNPPILIAGEMKVAVRRAAIYGDGWIPRYLWSTPESIAEGRDRMVDAYREFGRDPSTIDITLFGCRQSRDEMRRFEDAGVTRILFFLKPEPPQAMRDRLHRLAERVL